MENKMENFQWDLMIGQLRGLELNNFGLHEVAKMSCGPVVGTTTYDLLSQRLHQEDWRERFIAK